MTGGSFSASGRGWSDRALLLAGVAVLAILGLVTGLLLAKSKGYLEDTVKVDTIRRRSRPWRRCPTR